MSLVGKIFGGGLAEPIDAIGGIIDEVWTSEDEKLERKEIMARIRQKPLLAQLAINKVEAQHRSVFVAGARPAAMWVCVLALFYMWFFRPLMADVFDLFGHRLPALSLDITDLLALMLPLLGIGGYRTIEKLAGRTK